jgi:hypothetical protein
MPNRRGAAGSEIMTTQDKQLRNRIAAVLWMCVGLGFVWTLMPGRQVLAQNAPSKPAARAKAPTVSNPHGDIKIACETCHTAQSWTAMRVPTEFDHATTGFPLVGKHQNAACKECHASSVFKRVATGCVDCHRDVHQGKNGLRCQECHSPDRWAGRSDALRRHATTGFPLRGIHALIECSRCHGGSGESNIARVSADCISCHAAQFAAARSPDHTAGGFSSECQRCHDAGRTTWGGAGFDHALTGFPLTGAHRALNCTTCHTNGTHAGLSPDCYSCHQPNFAGVQNPNHVASGFSHQCTTCHSTTSWAGASFDHATTGFALTGAHRTATCTGCHAGGRFAGTPTDCYACHQSQFQAAANPNHVASGFSHLCTTCHSTTSWAGASFDHATTGFALTGAHTTASCTTCHAGGRFAGTPTDCNACHQAQYQATTNPNHTAAGFSTQCASCHTTARWQGATFDHDASFFRIYSGRHRNTWSSCTACHPNASSYQSFSCFQCHGQSSTDSKHRGVSGYRYESNACYSCHRRV